MIKHFSTYAKKRIKSLSGIPTLYALLFVVFNYLGNKLCIVVGLFYLSTDSISYWGKFVNKFFVGIFAKITEIYCFEGAIIK